MNYKVLSSAVNGMGVGLILASFFPDIVKLGPLCVVAAIAIQYWLVEDH